MEELEEKITSKIITNNKTIQNLQEAILDDLSFSRKGSKLKFKRYKYIIDRLLADNLELKNTLKGNF